MHMAPLHLLQQEGLAAAALTVLVGILVLKFFNDLLVSPSKSTFRIPEKGDPSSAIVLVGESRIYLDWTPSGITLHKFCILFCNSSLLTIV